MPNTVRDSIQNLAADHCVDLFEREDGSFGFEEYRRDVEDQKGWFSLQRYSQRVFDTQDLAMAAARAAVGWLADET